MPEELWFDRNVRQTVLQLVLGLELILTEFIRRLLGKFLVALNSAFQEWVSVLIMVQPLNILINLTHLLFYLRLSIFYLTNQPKINICDNLKNF